MLVKLAEYCEPGEDALEDISDELDDCESLVATGAYRFNTDPLDRRSVDLSGCRCDTELLLTLDRRSKNSLALRKRDTRLADLVRPVARVGGSSLLEKLSSRLESLPPLDREPPPVLILSRSSRKLTRID